MRAVVTGGAGLIGSHVVDLLVQRTNVDVVVLDNFVRGTEANLATAISSGRVHVVRGDIRDRRLVAEVIGGADVVYHLAALRITQCADDPRLALEVLVDGTYNVLEASVGARVGKVIASSSASIYGMASEFPTAEDHHPYNNRTLYGAAKAFNELLLRSFNEMYRLPYVALRYFNVYGPRMDVWGIYTEVLVRWMERIAAGQAPLIFGDGLQTMDFVNVRDVARANLLAAQAPVSDCVYNVASGREVSLRELLDALLKAMDSDLQPEYFPERKVNPVPRRLAATEAARRDLGFEVEVGLEGGLRELVEWWRATRAQSVPA